MKKVNIGIIGIGLIGKQHIENYKNIEGVDIIAVCDINEKEARSVADKYDIPHVYTDLHEMLKRDDIEAVDVCLHNNFHAPVSIAAMKAGKHVYCEKPIAGTYFDGKEMVDAAKDYNKKLHIQLGTLFNLETKVAERLIISGKLGDIFHGRANGFRRRNRPYVDGYGTPAFTRKEQATGGALIDAGIYNIGQMLYLLNLPEPVRISGKTYQEMEMDEQRRQKSNFDVEELAFGFVKFENDITLDIMSAWAIHLGSFEGSSIIGSKGGIRLPAYKQGVAISKFEYYSNEADIAIDSTIDLNATHLRWQYLHENYDAYLSSQHHWIAVLQGRVELMPTAEVALQTMLISEAIYISSDRGEEITAEEIKSSTSSTSVFI